MYKIIAYAVIDEEREYLEAWAKAHAHEVELTLTTDELKNETVHTAEGYDGVTTMQKYPIEEPVYSRLKKFGIRNIAQRSAGYDMYNLEDATANNIIITNVPSYSPESIAEFTIFSALRIIRKPDLISKRVLEQNFQWQGEILSRPINDMTVAVIGVGRIGSRVAKLFKNGFGAHVLGYDIEPKSEFDQLVEYVDSAEEAVKNADIVTLHMPLNDLNMYQFNKKLLSQFKPGSILINTARGKIVNTRDLINAIDSGHLAGAALDVYENEADYMPKDWRNQKIADPLFQELLNHPKIIYTPHIAYYTDTAIRNIAEGGLNSTLEVLKTGDAAYRVN